MTLGSVNRRSQPRSRDDYKTSLGLESFQPKRWRKFASGALTRLRAMDLPLLACGGGPDRKAPCRLRDGALLSGWQRAKHSVDDIESACGKVIACGTRTGKDAGGLLVFDVDGATALSWLLERGCDPAATTTWQIHRNTNPERLKVAFRLDSEQQQQLGQSRTKEDTKPPIKDADGKVIAKGEAVELFHGVGQVIVLGQHWESKGIYFWPDGMGPEDLAPIPPAWWAAALEITGKGTAKTKTKVSSTGKGDWSSLPECPICGRNTTGYCSQHRDGNTIRCFHGSTFSPELTHGKLRRGDEITDRQGTVWALSKTEAQANGDVFSVFVTPDPTRRKATEASSKGSAEVEHHTPESFAALIEALPDGWVPNENTGTMKRSQLAVGKLADLLEDRKGLLRFNELTLLVEVLTGSGWRQVVDADMDSAYVMLSQKGWKVGVDPVIKAVCHVARQQSFHPVQRYLLELEQNSKVEAFNLDEVAPRFFRSPGPLHVAMVRKWLIGAVARAMDPGCQMDYALVLQSRQQGIGKSTSFRDLASPDWFTSTVPDGDKDFLLNVHSCWIFELAELESVTGKRSAGRLKNLITTQADMFRVPYGRTNERCKRSSVFCGTVNEDTFLRDETGNRRYWVVPIDGGEPLDRDGLKAARDGIWKAALAAWRAGELPMLTRAQEALSEIQNGEFVQSDPWAEMVRAWMDGSPMHRWDPDRDPSTTPYKPNEPFTSAEVLYSAGLRRPDQITRPDQMRVGAVLRQLGFETKQRRQGGEVVRLWCRTAPALLSRPVTTCHDLSDRGCDTPNPLRQNDLQQLSRPSQPFSSEKLRDGAGEGQQHQRSSNGSPYVAKKVVTVVTPPANPSQEAGSGPSQPFSGGCDTPGPLPAQIPGADRDVTCHDLSRPQPPEVVQHPTRAIAVDGQAGWTLPGLLPAAPTINVTVIDPAGHSRCVQRRQITVA